MSDLIIRRLREENDTLREEVRQLREALCLKAHIPVAWGLSPCERRLLCALRTVSPHLLSVERAMFAIYADADDVPDPKVLYVLLAYLRRKLKRAGLDITIENSVAHGWRLPPDSCARLDAAIAADLVIPARAA